LLLAAGGALLLPGLGGVARTFAAPAAARTELSAADLHFAQEAAGAGAYAVEAGRLAEQRATHPQIKAFASMLAKYHAGANEELAALAHAHGHDLPAGLPPARRAAVDALGALAGEAFDRRFVEQVAIRDHAADIPLFEIASRSIADPGLRAWATKTLAALQEHLAAARQLPLTAEARPPVV